MSWAEWTETIGLSVDVEVAVRRGELTADAVR